MSGFLAGAGRVLACWMIFGYLAWQVHAAGLPEAVAVVVAAIVAFGLNRAWRQKQRQRLLREHREEVVADEQLRAEVRERRRQG